jgi:hypothetical protein
LKRLKLPPLQSAKILITPFNTKILNPPLKSTLKKEENLSKLLLILIEKEEWNLTELSNRAKDELKISKMTVWNYLLELDKYGMIRLKILKEHEEDNPSKRNSWHNHKVNKNCLVH